MPEPQKAKWHFIYSETLKQRIAFDEVSGWIFCKDGTKYSPQELALITDNKIATGGGFCPYVK